MTERRVEVVIDELVLHGFDRGHGGSIADAVAEELASALDGWRPPAGVEAARLDAGSFAIPANASAAAVGRALGRTIHVALTPPHPGPPPPGGREMAR